MLATVRNVGVIGAGTMGGGIAIAFANAGFEVHVVDVNPDALQRGAKRIREFYDDAIKRKKVATQVGNQRFSSIRFSSLLHSVAECELIVEAVFEDLNLKSQIAAELASVCTPDTVLASNTSSLDINLIAKASGRPSNFVGIHFFSPAHVMKLVEVVRGEELSKASVELAVNTVKALDKIPVVCGVGFGFIGNRMAEPYLREAEALLLEGATPAQIDAVAQSPDHLGMAMGPCRMMDLAGLDVGASIIAERAANTNLLDDKSYRCMVRELSAMGHFGQKTGRGFYRYDGRQPIDEPETLRVAEQLAEKRGVARRGEIPDDEILKRLLYPLINEGFDVLHEGIADDPNDIDLVFTAGFGFPKARGGPMAMARAIGLKTICEQIETFAKERGDPFGYWTPSSLLKEQAQTEETSL